MHHMFCFDMQPFFFVDCFKVRSFICLNRKLLLVKFGQVATFLPVSSLICILSTFSLTGFRNACPAQGNTASVVAAQSGHNGQSTETARATTQPNGNQSTINQFMITVA